VLLIISFYRKKKKQSESSPHQFVSRLHTFLLLCGSATIINIFILIMRMLSNNYRSFSEVRIHILLNYSLISLASLLMILLAANYKGVNHSNRHKFFYAATVLIMVSLIMLLINWHFLDVIA